MTLEERIEAWPETMKAALTRLAEAKAVAAKLADELEEVSALDDGVAAPPPRTRARQEYDEAEHACTEAKEAKRQAEAEADVAVRDEAEKAGKRLTDSAVRSRIRLYPAVSAAQEVLSEAERRVIKARSGLYSSAGQEEVATPQAVSGPSSAQVAKLERKHAEAEREVQRARIEVKYVRAVGQALQMLVALKGLEVPISRSA